MKERIDNISKTIAEWKTKRTGPARILLDPTDKCNLNCLFCWRNDSTQVSDGISDKRLLDLVDESVELGVKEWVISGGGDPFARKDLVMKLAEKIKKHNSWGQIITNATLLEEKDIIELVKIGWDQLQISVDGPEKVHDFLRNSRGTFARVIKVLKLFNKYKMQFSKSSESKPQIGFNVVLCNKNYKYIPYLIKLAYKYKCNQVWFEMIAPWSKEAKKLQFSEAEMKDLERYIRKGKALADKLKLWTNVHYYSRKTNEYEQSNITQSNIAPLKNNHPYCLAPWFSIKIHPTGVAGPCCSFYRHEPLGDINISSLKEIWYKNFEILRKNMLANKLPSYCRECTEGQKREMTEIKKRLG